MSGFLDILKTVFYAILIALVIRSCAYEPFNIPSGSMKPTLLVGDYLFVSKLSYGYSRYSLPFGLPLLPVDRVLFTEPERGDVAVFRKPSDPTTDYIKRIVGLPGDQIQVVDGILHINGEAVTRERTGEFIETTVFGAVKRTPLYRETLPGGVTHVILEESDTRPLDDTRIFTVPEGHYFAMGDNRDNSQDSRTRDVGFVPRENLIGRAEIRFFSIDGPAWKLWSWPWTVRWSRLFSGIE